MKHVVEELVAEQGPGDESEHVLRELVGDGGFVVIPNNIYIYIHIYTNNGFASSWASRVMYDV